MTDRPTQLVGSLHGSLYLMLIAWLALLHPITSVTLPYYLIYNNSFAWPSYAKTQALITNTNGTYHQLIALATGQIRHFSPKRFNTTSSPNNMTSSSTGRVDYMCPTTDTTCTAGTGSYSHPTLNGAFFGTASTAAPPKLSFYYQPTAVFYNITTTGFGNVEFIEFVPGTNRIVLPGADEKGISTYDVSAALPPVLTAVIQSPSTYSYSSVLCLNSSACLAAVLNTSTTQSLWIENPAISTPAQFVMTIPTTATYSPFSMKRLTALNLFAVANGSQWITFYSMSDPTLVYGRTKTSSISYKIEMLTTYCDTTSACLVYGITNANSNMYVYYVELGVGTQIVTTQKWPGSINF